MPALAIAAIGSFFAGTVSTIVIATLAPPLANVALSFGAPEYFSLMLLGLVASVVLPRGSLLKPIGMIGRLMPSREDWKRIIGPIIRGTAIGSFLGILPGGGALLASFSAYSIEKKISNLGQEFGTGAIEGVAAPESANNAGSQTSFIPMLTLGIPTSPVMALMIRAMVIQGLQPGPSLTTERPQFFWGVIASMWIGNLMLLVLTSPPSWSFAASGCSASPTAPSMSSSWRSSGRRATFSTRSNWRPRRCCSR